MPLDLGGHSIQKHTLLKNSIRLCEQYHRCQADAISHEMTANVISQINLIDQSVFHIRMNLYNVIPTKTYDY